MGWKDSHDGNKSGISLRSPMHQNLENQILFTMEKVSSFNPEAWNAYQQWVLRLVTMPQKIY